MSRVGTTLPSGSVAWMDFVVPLPDDGGTWLPPLAAVEHAQHQHGAAIVAVLKCVGAAEQRQHDFAILGANAEWASQVRMAAEQIGPRAQFRGDAELQVPGTGRAGRRRSD